MGAPYIYDISRLRVKHLQVPVARYTRTGTERGIGAPRLYYALASVLGDVILIPVITARNK